MEKRLTYKIGEKCGVVLWQFFCDEWVAEMERFSESLKESFSKVVESLQHLFDEIRYVEKPKLPRPQKVIRPSKPSPHFTIIPHARTVC